MKIHKIAARIATEPSTCTDVVISEMKFYGEPNSENGLEVTIKANVNGKPVRKTVLVDMDNATQGDVIDALSNGLIPSHLSPEYLPCADAVYKFMSERPAVFNAMKIKYDEGFKSHPMFEENAPLVDEY
jgi:hypothetical protein